MLIITRYKQYLIEQRQSVFLQHDEREVMFCEVKYLRLSSISGLSPVGD